MEEVELLKYLDEKIKQLYVVMINNNGNLFCGEALKDIKKYSKLREAILKKLEKKYEVK